MNITSAYSLFGARLAWLVGLALMPALASAQFTLPMGEQLSLAPSAATPAGMISVAGSRLADGAYRVELVDDRVRHTLVSISAGTGEFQRTVTIPSLGAGSYPVQLLVDGSLVDSVSLRVLPPLSVTPLNLSPRAGSKLKFTVGGLAEGSLTMMYAGKAAFGPVKVGSGSFSGTLIVPTDRPASLPATVALGARNTIGKLVPRVGTRNLSVQSPDLSPFARVLSATASNTTPSPRQRFSVSGSVATNDADIEATTVTHYWVGDNGSVIPMGAVDGALQADGSFNFEMVTPQIGTGSAGHAQGSGHVMSVTQWRDERGVLQSESQRGSSLAASIDTDAAIDISLVLTGADGRRIEDARVVLSNADLDELYPPNSNEGGVFLNGASQHEFSQFETTPLYLNGSCPPNETRQYTDADGRAEFQFGLDIPQGFTTLDGGVTPLLTIEPDTICTNADINTHFCLTSDPAGIQLTLSILALHKGYGYAEESIINGQTLLRENTVKIHARIDRYNGAIQADICHPGQSVSEGTCTRRDFSRSANLSITLPIAPKSGLILSAPYLPPVGGENGITIASAQWGEPVVYAPIVDLTPFKGRATFSPSAIPQRFMEVQYLRGAGPAMAPGFPKLVIPSGDGRNELLTMSKVGNGDNCAITEGGSETYRVTLPAASSEGLRFPRDVFGNRSEIRGYVIARDMGDRYSGRLLKFPLPSLESSLAALANRSGLTLNTTNPHSRKLTIAPDETKALTHSDAPPAEFNVGAKDNSAAAHEDYEVCIPSGPNCGAYTSLDSSHLQFNREGDSPPSGGSSLGSDDIDEGSDAWEILFEKTIPLFRWYWGVPELLSAEVFADLKLKAEYLFKAAFDPDHPGASSIKTGGRMGVGIFIGVDIDVLFGILVDAGAGITGILTGEVVAESGFAKTPCVREDLTFSMDFSGWLEIGCPIPNPFDPTCYIPDIEESYNILNERIFGSNQCIPVNKRRAGPGLEALMAKLGGAFTAPTGIGTVRPVAINPVQPEQRRSMNRHSAIAADGVGNQMYVFVNDLGKLTAIERNAAGDRTGARELSAAFGIRDVAVSYFSTDRAVAVWSESDITSVNQVVTDIASRQYLRYAIWNGDAWSSSVALTSAGFGDGGTRMARCTPRPSALRGDCVSQRVSVVYQRNTQRRMGGHKHIYLRHFNGTGWSAEERVDTSGDYNMTPTIAYQNAQPVVAWVRYDPGTTSGTAEDPTLPALSKVDARRIALRTMDGSGVEEVVSGLSTRVAQPSLGTIDGTTLAIAYTRAASGDAFVGLRQALHLSTLSCATRPCRGTARIVRDARGRPIYGERPTLIVRPNGGVSVGFRALSLGAVPGAPNPESNLFPDDPPGLLNGFGAIVDLRANLATGRVALVDMTSNLGVGAQPAFAADPVSNELLAIQSLVDVGDVFTKRMAGKESLAKLETLDEGVQLASANDVPDLAIDTVEGTATRLVAGTDVPVTVRVINRGSDWTADAEHVATLRLYWDTPETRTTLLAQIPLTDLAAGSSATHVVQARVPAAFGVDERQSVRAEILVESPEGELDGGNNVGAVALGGMPIPLDLHSLSLPGSRLVNIDWTPMTDDRIAGYRIYIEAGDGSVVPIGSSFNPGFTDLSARYGQTRTYRVSTYSARGIESELSQPVSAEPAPAQLADGVFGDGFEATAQ